MKTKAKAKLMSMLNDFCQHEDWEDDSIIDDDDLDLDDDLEFDDELDRKTLKTAIKDIAQELLWLAEDL